MKSLIASLRSLTLPFGATDGARIVLDGVNGTIQLYNADNVLIVELQPFRDFSERGSFNIYYTPGGTIFLAIEPETGFRMFDTNEKWRLGLAPDGIPMMSSLPGHTSATNGGIGMTGFPLANDIVRLRLSTGYPTDVADLGSTEFHLYSSKNNFSQSPFVQAAFVDLHASVTRPRIDLTGAGGTGGSPPAAGQEARTVVYDLWYGTPSPPGLLPTEEGSYGRGVVGYQDLATVDAARAAGVNTDMFVTFDADSTRLYEVSIKTQINVGTAAVVYALSLVEGGTVGGADGTVIDRFDRYSAAMVPAGSTTIFCKGSCLYMPSTSGSKTLRFNNSGGSGGTIACQGAGGFHRQMFVKDIGLQ